MTSQAIELIEEQTSKVDPEEVEEISLDQTNLKSFEPALVKKLESFKNLASLSLNNCNLSTLDNFPKLSKLTRLELIDNKLDGSQLRNLTGLQNLLSLSLSRNNISSIEELTILSEIPVLFQLDVIGNDVDQIDGYSKRLFQLIPSLQILDNRDQHGEGVNYDDQDDDDEEAEDDEDGDDDDDDIDDDNLDEDSLSDDEEDDEDEDEEGDFDENDEDDDEDADQIEQKSTQRKKFKPN